MFHILFLTLTCPLSFHSETRILTTIFGLLFWDIIFADVPGAFDTPYQYAPLDLFHDSFYRARKPLIDKRLKEIEDGQAGEILSRHDDNYREKKVVCACVSWDLCPKEDLVNILDVRQPIPLPLFSHRLPALSVLAAVRCPLYVACSAKIMAEEAAGDLICLSGMPRNGSASSLRSKVLEILLKRTRSFGSTRFCELKQMSRSAKLSTSPTRKLAQGNVKRKLLALRDERVVDGRISNLRRRIMINWIGTQRNLRRRTLLECQTFRRSSGAESLAQRSYHE